MRHRYRRYLCRAWQLDCLDNRGSCWRYRPWGDRLLVHGDGIREQRAAGGAVQVDNRDDAANQLIEVDEASRLGRRRTRFAYDALGRRVSKATAEPASPPPSANGNTPPAPAETPAWHETRFLWDGNLLLAESTSADPLATVYLFEPGSFRPLAQVRREAANAPGFKPEVGYVQRYAVTPGTQIQWGPVGPQTYNGVTYPGGGSQVQLLVPPTDRMSALTPIGDPIPIE